MAILLERMPNATVRLFVSNRALDCSLDSGAVLLDGDRLQIREIPQISWALEPGVHIVRLDSADGDVSDAEELVGQVRTSGELDALGAEHFGTAVVVGELAYTVLPGFVASAPMGDGGFSAWTPDLRDIVAGVFETIDGVELERS